MRRPYAEQRIDVARRGVDDLCEDCGTPRPPPADDPTNAQMNALDDRAFGLHLSDLTVLDQGWASADHGSRIRDRTQDRRQRWCDIPSTERNDAVGRRHGSPRTKVCPVIRVFAPLGELQP